MQSDAAALDVITRLAADHGAAAALYRLGCVATLEGLQNSYPPSLQAPLARALAALRAHAPVRRGAEPSDTA